MTRIESAARELQDQAALWSVGEARAGDVVRAAGAALVAGLDGPALRILAACTRAEADREVPEVLPEALSELGLTFHPLGSESGREAVARVLACRMLAGELSPRDLARHVHHRWGHDLALTRRLAELDDAYDLLEYGASTAEEIDAEVAAEARRLAAHPHVPADPTGTSG